MTAYRAPDFHERAALSRQSRQKALDQLRTRPVPSEAELAKRKAARLEREEAEDRQRAIRAAEKQAADARAVAAAEARAAEAVIVPAKSEAEKKAARDARYAARKSRK